MGRTIFITDFDRDIPRVILQMLWTSTSHLRFKNLRNMADQGGEFSFSRNISLHKKLNFPLMISSVNV